MNDYDATSGKHSSDRVVSVIGSPALAGDTPAPKTKFSLRSLGLLRKRLAQYAPEYPCMASWYVNVCSLTDVAVALMGTSILREFPDSVVDLDALWTKIEAYLDALDDDRDGDPYLWTGRQRVNLDATEERLTKPDILGVLSRFSELIARRVRERLGKIREDRAMDQFSLLLLTLWMETEFTVQEESSRVPDYGESAIRVPRPIYARPRPPTATLAPPRC
ncbi:hypothetical protein [Deinococcus alpinitundrae]|uniref:hypothetical protein n=1 Tax=Deinococcus alpinitundrae TaxID=468913 RepID=UPI001379FFC2|nr:hypothetical protein [Deinococcus alpinitundrae]